MTIEQEIDGKKYILFELEITQIRMKRLKLDQKVKKYNGIILSVKESSSFFSEKIVNMRIAIPEENAKLFSDN
ncbi:hypothetical protein [Flavobacterium limnosediminis]|uniref:hypothetical protein n=1 Tax=Flavobacterium limnosediminis TaxID=1401027 RepID=UPI000416C6C0|nr:hypothetical protein [Flavobacterium limnosediminis]